MEIFTKKDIIHGAFNKISKGKDSVDINIKSKDKNIDINLTGGKAILTAGVVAIAPTAICVLGGTIGIYVIAKKIYTSKKSASAQPRSFHN